MRKVCAALLVVVAVSSPILVATPRARACGDPGPSFVAAAPHAAVMPPFVRGALGIVSPHWDPAYLVVAYRHLGGAPPTEMEIASILETWLDAPSGAPVEPSEAWRQARRDVVGDQGPGITTWRTTRNHAYYEVCPLDAFRTAARVLRERAAAWGPGSRELRDWVAAQDRVFAACGSASAPAPDQPAATSSPQQAADRRYQLAASNLYRERFDDARRAFDAIAADASSPWREVAPYLAARALVRQSTLTADPFDADVMRQAERRLVSLAADATRPAMHASARRMLDLVRFRIDPDAQTRALARELSTPAAGDDAGSRLTDLVRGWERARYEHAARERLARGNDLLMWLDVFTRPATRAFPLATARYRETHAIPWLVAALTHAAPDQAEVPELMARAAAVPRSSPAFASLAFHRVRLLASSGRVREARALLRSVRTADWPAATRDAFRALALHIAPDMRAWLASAQRTEIGQDSRTAAALHEDVREAIRAHLPLERIESVVASDVIDTPLRVEIARAGFLRALLLERHSSARRFATQLLALAADAPEAADLRAYLVANRSDRTAIGLLAVLRNDSVYGEPSISSVQLTSFRPACPEVLCDVSTPAYAPVMGLATPSLPADLTAAERGRGEDEARGLLAHGTLLNLIGRHVLAWAERDSTDPRAPEALHRLVSATRRASFHATSDERTGRLSRSAFQILHRRYPNDEWTQRTRHWYR